MHVHYFCANLFIYLNCTITYQNYIFFELVQIVHTFQDNLDPFQIKIDTFQTEMHRLD